MGERVVYAKPPRLRTHMGDLCRVVLGSGGSGTTFCIISRIVHHPSVSHELWGLWTLACNLFSQVSRRKI